MPLQCDLQNPGSHMYMLNGGDLLQHARVDGLPPVPLCINMSLEAPEDSRLDAQEALCRMLHVA